MEPTITDRTNKGRKHLHTLHCVHLLARETSRKRIILIWPCKIAFLFRLFDNKASSASLDTAVMLETEETVEAETSSEKTGKRESLLPAEDRIVVEKLKYDVLCGICCEIISHPRQCLSGHAYCGDCVAKCIAKEMSCPSCRRTLTEETVARNLMLEEYIKEFLVHCQYHYEYPDEEDPEAIVDEAGCPEEIPLLTKLMLSTRSVSSLGRNTKIFANFALVFADIVMLVIRIVA